MVKTARGLLPRARDEIAQIAYYHDGVGTNWGLDKIAGGCFGVGLSANIVDMYQFLVLNYEPGDEIFLFGFSRGAYTVRSLAGVLDTPGLVDRVVAKTPRLQGTVDLGGDELALGERTTATAVDRCLLAALDQVEDLGDPAFIDE